MYIQKTFEKRTGRTFLTMIRSYRENGKIMKETVESLGYLDELEKEYPDALNYFKNRAKELTKLEQEKKAVVSFSFSLAT